MTNKCCTVDNGHRKSSDAAVFSFFFTLKIWKITDLSSHIFSYWITSVKSQCLNRAFVRFLHFLPVENILQFQGVLILKETDKHFFWPRTWKSGILFKILFFRKDHQYKTLQNNFYKRLFYCSWQKKWSCPTFVPMVSQQTFCQNLHFKHDCSIAAQPPRLTLVAIWSVEFIHMLQQKVPRAAC